MNREQAMAPLAKGEGRFPMTAGLLLRGAIRRTAIASMIDFYEEKGIFESTFIFRGPAGRVLAFHEFLKKNYEEG